MKGTHSRFSAILPLAGLCLLGTIAYSNSLDVPFVFDDLVSIERNAGVRFGDYLSGSLLWTRSILYVTFALNHQYGGIEVWSYHAINLIIHLLNGIVVFYIARHIFGKWSKNNSRLFAFLAAAFFLVHPVQTESVTYVSSRSELLATFFYALAFLLFIRWPEKKIGFLLAALVTVLFVFGLGAKETVISLPAVFVLYDFIFLSQGSVRPLLSRWRFYSVFLVGGVLAGLYLLRQWATFFSPDSSLLSPWHYFLTQLRVIIRYIQVLFVPAGLNLDYDFRPATSFLEPSVFLSFLALSGLLVVAYVWRRRHPLFAFSTFWFFITLAPTSSLIPIQDVIFEHRLYPALIGVCLGFPVLVEWSMRRLSALYFPGRGGVAVPAVSFAILAVFLTATFLRNDIWRDPVRLYADIVSKSPSKERAHRALAMEFVKRGDLQSATRTMQTAIDRVPAESAVLLHNDLGNIYLQTRQYDEAIYSFTKCLSSDHAAIAYNNIGVAYLNLWEQLKTKRPVMSPSEFASEKSRILGEGKKAFRASYELDSSNLGSLDSFINLSYFEGNTDSLRLELEAQYQADPGFETAYSVGRLELWAGNFAEAAKYFDRADVKATAGHRLFEFNYGYALSQLGDVPGAIDRYTRALRIDPTFKEAHYNLAYVYWKSGDLKKAVEHFTDVLARDPRHVPTLISLAKVDIERGNPSQAREYLRQAIQINHPQQEEAQAILQSLGG